MIAFFRFVLIGTTLVLIATVSAVITMRFAIHGAEVTIPDFKGESIAAATQQAAALGVNLQVEAQLYSTELPARRVVTQSPAPGSVVRREWQVRVTDSLGPQKIAVPNLLGQQERIASIEVRRVGLQLGEVAHMPDAQVAAGTVIAQDPMPNAAGVERPSVSLLVAEAEPTPAAAFIMPDYTGQPAAAASTALAGAGLPPATLRDALPSPNGTIAGPPGVVVRQSPAPGERVTMETAIVFDVAR